MIRIDLFLKNVGLCQSRSQAKRCCEEGRTRIDGRPVRPSYEVRIGDRLCVETATHQLELEVLDTPTRPVPRGRRSLCYRLVQQRPLVADILGFDDDP